MTWFNVILPNYLVRIRIERKMNLKRVEVVADSACPYCSGFSWLMYTLVAWNMLGPYFSEAVTSILLRRCENPKSNDDEIHDIGLLGEDRDVIPEYAVEVFLLNCCWKEWSKRSYNSSKSKSSNSISPKFGVSGILPGISVVVDIYRSRFIAFITTAPAWQEAQTYQVPSGHGEWLMEMEGSYETSWYILLYIFMIPKNLCNIVQHIPATQSYFHLLEFNFCLHQVRWIGLSRHVPLQGKPNAKLSSFGRAKKMAVMLRNWDTSRKGEGFREILWL